MIGTLAWKEYREQRSVWLVLAGLTVVLLVGVVELPEPLGLPRSDSLHVAILAGFLAVVLACTYGVVCGAMLLAGEREAGTLPFLQILAGQRAPLWATKTAVGAALTFGQALLVAGVMLVLGVFPPLAGEYGLVWPVILFILPLATFAWGMLSSSMAGNVLAAAALSLGFMLAAQVPLVALVTLTGSDLAGGVGQGALGLVALWLSRRRFCANRPEHGPRIERLAGWRVLAWLTLHQGWGQVVVLAVAALLAGFVLPQAGWPFWIAVTLLLGTIAGTAVFADEQAGGASQFLGDQRLPPGRVWSYKMACWLSLAIAAAIATYALGILVMRIGSSPEQSTILSGSSPGQGTPEGDPRWVQRLLGIEPLLWRSMGWCLPLVLGFANAFSIGPLLVMVVRKPVVAVVLAMLLSGAVVGLWLPSLVAGGLPAWQVLAVPVLFLAASRWAVRPWVGGRLGTGKPALALTGVGVLAAVWVAGCLWYRVLQVPDGGEPFDVQAFVAGLPTPEHNRAGRLLPRAVQEFGDQYARAQKELPSAAQPSATQQPGQEIGAPPAEEVPGFESDEVPGFESQALRVEFDGWAKATPEFGRMLDVLFEGRWVQTLREVATAPPGMATDPQTTSLATVMASSWKYYQMGGALAARALQLQACGHPDQALDLLETGLALARQLQHKATSFAADAGRQIEDAALRASNTWQRDLKGPEPALRRRALEVLTRHERLRPPLADRIKADYLYFRNKLEDSSRWTKLAFRPALAAGPALTAAAWYVPWEKARRTRILNAAFALWLHAPQTKAADSHLPLPGFDDSWVFQALFQNWSYPQRPEQQSLLAIRQTRLALALALFENDNGRPARTLNDLVPRYLAEPLINPVTEAPLSLPAPEKRQESQDRTPK